jgi:hypothetical protein
MTDSTSSSLDDAAASVRAAWQEFTIARNERERDDPEQDRRYITALWRVQNAEEDYVRVQERVLRG